MSQKRYEIHSYNGIQIWTYTRPIQERRFKWRWVTWQNIQWQEASRRLSATAELLVLGVMQENRRGFFVNAGHSWVEVCNCLRRCDDIVPREAATVAGDVDTGRRQKTLCWVAIAASSLSTHGSRGSSGQLVSATAVPSRAASCDSAGADWSSGRWRYHDYDTAPTKRARRDLRRRLHCSATVAARPDDTGRSRYDPRPGCGKCRRRTPDCILPHRSRIPRRRR